MSILCCYLSHVPVNRNPGIEWILNDSGWHIPSRSCYYLFLPSALVCLRQQRIKSSTRMMIVVAGAFDLHESTITCSSSFIDVGDIECRALATEATKRGSSTNGSQRHFSATCRLCEPHTGAAADMDGRRKSVISYWMHCLNFVATGDTNPASREASDVTNTIHQANAHFFSSFTYAGRAHTTGDLILRSYVCMRRYALFALPSSSMWAVCARVYAYACMLLEVEVNIYIKKKYECLRRVFFNNLNSVYV